MERFHLEASWLRRTMADVIDHGIQPKACVKPPPDSISDLFLLLWSNLGVLVCYKSKFVALGLGICCLSLAELGVAWNLSHFQLSLLKSLADLPQMPLLLGDTVLRSWLRTRPSDPILQGSSSLLQVPQVVDDSGGVWFPEIGATLPNTWRLKGITSIQAAKNVNAPVVYDMWDYRILPFFPHLNQ